MSEEIAVWRQAIQDEQHPLNRAAWMLFSKEMNVKYAERVLAEQKDDVIAFCNLILDTDALYDGKSLGSGNAPIHAVELLCHWKVEDSLPRLLSIMENEEWGSDIYGATADGIAKFGTMVVDPLIDISTRVTDDEMQVAIAGTLADAAPGDLRTVEFIRALFESRTEDFEIGYMAENVLLGDPEGGISWLQDRMRRGKYSKEILKRVGKLIGDARAGLL